ncbi:response regulator [Candidatus Poribacteria bacterium]|nr:response regulator [Candidatus Poribacteria bacterium]
MNHWNNRILIADDQAEIHQGFEEMLNPPPAPSRTQDDSVKVDGSGDNRPRWNRPAPIPRGAGSANFLPAFELLHASDGKEALQKVKTAIEVDNPIAVAYIDLTMPPGWDGLETTRRIRESDRAIEIVLMGAETHPPLSEMVREIELPHKTLYVRKPYVREEIQQIALSLTHRWNIEKERADYLGIALHDLRSPLTVIFSTAQLLQNQVVENSQELLQLLVKSSRSMLDLLNGIREIEEIEGGRISLDKEQQNLLPILERSLKNYAPIAQAKSITIKHDNEIQEAQALIDATHIEKVFNHLLSNAIKYSHPGTTITVSTAILDQHIQIGVSDQGIGIRQDEVDRVFTKFSKLSNKPTAGESSTGLDLAIVKKLVELHGGVITVSSTSGKLAPGTKAKLETWVITVSSTSGKGTTFTVTLPILEGKPQTLRSDQKNGTKEALPPAPIEASPQKVERSEIPQSGAEASPLFHSRAVEPLTALLIDDSQGVRRLLAPMLKELGLNVIGEASNGREGVDRYKELRPDVVFIDIIMPQLSGVEALQQIREINPDALAVMLTSMADRKHVMASKNAGAFTYILKPFDETKIERVVSEIKRKLV